jgi:hypothetical protein
MKVLVSACMMILFSGFAWGQCQSWVNSPKKDIAEEAHVLYRQALKSKDYQTALEQWQVAFDIAPAADGHRATHFIDGIEIYKHLFSIETDEAKKDEYKKKVMHLYDNALNCMKQKSIVYKNCEDQSCIDQRIGWLMGNKAYDMFYTFYYPRAETYEVLKESVKLTGNAAEYTVLYPYPAVVVYLFQSGKIDKAEALSAYTRLNEIADYGIENHPNYGAYYQQAKDAITSTYAMIEDQIFDCEYFIAKHTPEYEADPTNPELLKRIIVSLKEHGCTTGTAFLDKVEAEYGQIAAAYNAAQQAEFEKNNPSIMAKRLFDEGKYSQAIAKYKEAIAAETDRDKQAGYHFSIASIQFRQLSQYAAARESAKTAAQLRGNWGRPYMLIGDMYAKSSSSCGNDAYSRGLAVLAAIDKWAYARSIDGEVADEANKKIATYSDHIPPQDDAFMMGKSEGQSDQAGCWIGETVRLRFN